MEKNRFELEIFPVYKLATGESFKKATIISVEDEHGLGIDAVIGITTFKMFKSNNPLAPEYMNMKEVIDYMKIDHSKSHSKRNYHIEYSESKKTFILTSDSQLF